MITVECIDGSEELLRLREMFAQSPSFSALLHGPNIGSCLPIRRTKQLFGHRDVVGARPFARPSPN